jgi:uncharacterized protein YciW
MENTSARSFELENLEAHSMSRSSTQNLPSIKEEETEDKISILVDKLDTAIDVIKLRENEIKRLDETIVKLNEMSTSNQVVLQQEHTHSNKSAEKRKMSRVLMLAMALTVAAVIALIVLMVAFGFIIAFIFEK